MGSRERQVKYDRSVLGGEGSDEIEFFKYLVSLYSDDLTNPKLCNGHGGNPKQATKVALRDLPQLGAYQHRMMVFDGDKATDVVQAGIGECEKEPEIEYLVSDIRFEVEMGRILGCSDKIMRDLQSSDSAVVKRVFAKVCPPCADRYGKLLPKEVLDEKRKESVWLDKIIRFIENRGVEEDDVR